MASRRSVPLRAWRIADGRRPILDGTGAALYGGRWNSPGRRVIYASATYAAALLECLVHTNIGRIPQHQMFVEITVPAGVRIETADPAAILGWDAENQMASRRFGDTWYDARRTAVLRVPSVVARAEWNVLIHQEHSDFPKITASDPKPVLWDERLFRR